MTADAPPQRLPPPLRRVLVIGCPGSGKSTFAMALERATGLPFVSLDAAFWRPGWVMSPRAEWRAKVAEVIAGDSWIMDGNYASTLDIRLPRADTLVWFRTPRRVCMARVIKRIATSYGHVRPEMASGCPEKLDWGFQRYVWRFERDETPQVVRMIAAHGQHLSPVIFRHDADVGRFLMSWGEPG